MVSFQSNKNLKELVRAITGSDNFSQFTRESVKELLEKLDLVEKEHNIDLRDGKFTFNVNLNGEVGEINEWTGNGFCSRAEFIKIAIWSRILSMIKDEEPTFLTANELVRSLFNETSRVKLVPKNEVRENAKIL